MDTGDQAVKMNVPLHVEDKEANVILYQESVAVSQVILVPNVSQVGYSVPVCQDGYWGPGCENECSTTCRGQRGKCNPLTGKCRCFPGYTGSQCESGRLFCSSVSGWILGTRL